MSISIPEFPAGHWQRSWPLYSGTSLLKSESFDPYHYMSSGYMKGRDFEYDRLLDGQRRAMYRYFRTKKRDGGHTPIRGLHSRTKSIGDLDEAHARKAIVALGRETSSQTSNDGSDESSSEASASEYAQQSLCKRCCMINIDRLSQERGYAHSTMDVLKESAKSCELCRTFCFWFDCAASVSTLDRYIVRLSLDIGNGSKEDFPAHSQTQLRRWKCICVEVFDTRPWQSLEPGTEGAVKGVRAEYESAKPQEEDNAHGRRVLCYTEEGDPAVDAGLPWLRKDVGDTGSPSSLNVANEWLERCLAAENSGKKDAEPHHDDDYEDAGSPTTFPDDRPTRLLEIVPSVNSDHQRDYSVKLIETNGLEYRYIALSYCWGKITDAKWLMNTNTIQQYLQLVDLGALPATIRDFLYIAASLGVRHVWVDSLCIIQDSPSDWETESTKMGGIYRGALLTVAASRSSNSSDGCFNRDKSSSHFNPLAGFIRVDSRLSNGKTSRIYLENSTYFWDPCTAGDLFDSEVYSNPLTQRAWAYQEQVFSRRILYFANSQLYWECDHCRLSQDNLYQPPVDRAYPVLTVSAPLRMDEVISAWYHGAVQTYSKRGLTCPEDKLVAISAVAKATYLNRGIEYVAGLWGDSILPGLCWYRDGEGRKNMAYQCPSWSWASQQSGVTYRAINSFKEPDEARPNMIKVLDVQIARSETNPFGNVRSGRITLHTKVAAGTVVPDEFGQSHSGFSYGVRDIVRPDLQALVIPERVGQDVWQGVAVLDDEGHRCQQVVIALIALAQDPSDFGKGMAKWWSILLQNAGEGEQTYRRVGLGVVEERYTSGSWKREKPNFDREWTEQVITII